MASESDAGSLWPIIVANAAGWAAAIGGAVKWVWTIRDSQKEAMDKVLTEHKEEVRREMKSLWDKHDDHERILRNVPTKDDLARLRTEIRDDLKMLLGAKGA